MSKEWFQGTTLTQAPKSHKILTWLCLRPKSITAILNVPFGL